MSCNRKHKSSRARWLVAHAALWTCSMGPAALSPCSAQNRPALHLSAQMEDRRAGHTAEPTCLALPSISLQLLPESFRAEGRSSPTWALAPLCLLLPGETPSQGCALPSWHGSPISADNSLTGAPAAVHQVHQGTRRHCLLTGSQGRERGRAAMVHPSRQSRSQAERGSPARDGVLRDLVPLCTWWGQSLYFPSSLKATLKPWEDPGLAPSLLAWPPCNLHTQGTEL